MLLADPHIKFPGRYGRSLKISETVDDTLAYTQLSDRVSK